MKEGLIGKKKGQLSLELIMAMTLLAIGLTSIVTVHFSNQSIFLDSRLNSRALYMARSELETARALVRQDIGLLASASSTDGIYTKELTVEDTGTFSRVVTSKISWQASPLRTLNVTLLTEIADWEALREVGGGGGLDGDWVDPVTASEQDLGPTNEGTDIDVSGNYLYVTAAPSGGGGGPVIPRDDFYIYRIVDPFNPSFISSIDTGEGLVTLSVDDGYAYAASLDNTAQLQIIGGLPASPTLVSTSTMISNSSEGSVVFARDNYAFLGSQSSASGAELQIFSVGNKSNPSIETTIEIGTDVSDIYVFKDRLYVTTLTSTAQVLIFDISNISDPELLATYSNGSGSGGYAVFPINYSTLFVGIGNAIYVLDTKDLGDIKTYGQYDAGGKIIDLYVRDYLAFAGVNNSSKELQIVNINDYANPYLHSYINFPQVVTGIDYQDNFVYSSVRSNNGVRIITSRDE